MHDHFGPDTPGLTARTPRRDLPAWGTRTRRHPPLVITGLVGLALAAGCASVQVSDRQELVTGPLPRPAVVWVYDFAATPADVPAHSVLAGQVATDPSQTPEHIATGRKLGAEIATELIADIRTMGMSAEHGLPGTKPKINDLVVHGALISFKEGSSAERVGVGLGAGSSELRAAVEGFQVTAQGLRKLGSGDTSSESGKTPGVALGAATFLATHNPLGLIVSSGMKFHEEKTGGGTVEGRAKQTADEIAEALKKRFKEEGWVK